MAFNRIKYMKQYHKEWYLANKDRLLTKMRLYAVDNSEKIVEYKKNWYQNNRNRIIQKSKIRYNTTKDTSRFAYNLKTLYGLSVERYMALAEEQNGVCAICKEPPERRLSVDHDHRTDKVRGLLCGRCNFAIGLFKEKQSNLEAAISYLKESYE